MIYDQSIWYLLAMYKIQIAKCSKLYYDLLCVFSEIIFLCYRAEERGKYIHNIVCNYYIVNVDI